ncbi:hypothetical protein ABB37_01743 [Leptomonas pyrrhocoris]|uniref:Uncharacterized protein n=1 Tax=Leptomonas pyrrhocoris TaxID=157538 RepID=A0A0M9G9B9_LEPPY|nr:hypothetical protein ABB37_01743 [Leptomonas pyrrhocoris]KPA85443.1 hypothetical protein ABB37_01743 [Leptomonas pyrrhocoris]|eukprot:XP_015663882.1 hypothetical protein ABB37_01743 [Leptomonas pyrrhocoris]
MSRQAARSSAAEPSSLHERPIPELRSEIKKLESILEDRKLLFVDLCEMSGTSTAVTPGTGASPSLPRIAAASDDLAAEARQLAARNAFLTSEIAVLESMERQFASDPRVLDKRNEVKLVRMQIAQVERDIATLQTVKKRRDVGLRAIGRSEEQVRRARGQQQEVNTELREEVRQLTEELRGLERTDIDTHERYARLQDQIKLSVTDNDVQALRDEVTKLEADIESLLAKEAAVREKRASARDEDHRSIVKTRRECAAMEEEEARLRNVLMQKDLELKRSYQAVGRLSILDR